MQATGFGMFYCRLPVSKRRILRINRRLICLMITIAELAAYEDIYEKITCFTVGDEKGFLWDIYIRNRNNDYHACFSVDLRFFSPPWTDTYTPYTCWFYIDNLRYLGGHNSYIQKRRGGKSN